MTDPLTLIVTPTQRLARTEKWRLAEHMRNQGRSAWVAPPVLAFSSWIGQLRSDWFLAGDDPRVPITASQALVLWQQVIDRDIFIGEPRVAELAAGAWRLLHEYRLQPPEQWTDLHLNLDSRRFRDWAARFRALCEQRELVDEWTFASQLPELIGSRRIALPTTIRLTGFDLPLTPLQRAVIEAAENGGVNIERGGDGGRNGPLSEVSAFADADAELHAAARWARSRLEAGDGPSIAIVVPDLRGRLAAAERILRQVFDPPGHSLSPGGHEPWHLSLGPTLSRWPLVADALGLIRADPARLSQPEAGAILRSPYLSGAEGEQRARALTLADLARHKPYWMRSGELAFQAGRRGATRLQGLVTEWELTRREHRDAALPSTWVARLQTELHALGFGHGRALDSREYQVLQRFHDLLEEFSALDLVIGRPVSRHEAVRRLCQRASDTSFRERNPGAPVEILGVEEALGSRFDAVWITTLDHQSWPGPARREPLIPGPVQQQLPAATSQGCLERSRLELEGLLRTGAEITGSFTRGGDETRLELTALLQGCTVVERLADRDEPVVALEVLAADVRAPELADQGVQGGTGLLQDQSDCPFRAFAHRRLGADDLTPPRPGLDAMLRGGLVHKALELFWCELKGNVSPLASMTDTDREQRISAASQGALDDLARRKPLALSAAGIELERQCLERALRNWLALESGREAFTVTELEAPIELRFGDLELAGKIDRVDQIEGGGPVVIDYKTGASGRSEWAPDPRLADVQLPAYALNLKQRPVAIAFACLRPDRMGFDGLAEVDIGTPGVQVIGRIGRRSKFTDVESWDSLLGEWQHSLEGLAADFVAGHAEVDPRDNRVCRYCHLHSLCRIHERTWTDTDARADDD